MPDETIYAAAPTGVTATDNANLVAAVAACPAGGVVQLQAGTYALVDATTTSSLAIAKNLTLRGTGGADALWSHFGTLLTVDHPTAVAVEISAHGVNVCNLAIQNTHATAPTAGAGVQTVTGGGNSTHYGPNLSVRGFYINIDHQAGGEWFMDESVFLYDFAYVGLKIQNVDSPDGGDMIVSGLIIAGPTNNGHVGLLWESGGGLRCKGLKVNTRGSATLLVGICIELQPGIATGDLLLSGSSVENCSWGFLLEHAGGSNSGTFNNVVITGNEFSCLGTAAIAVSPGTTGRTNSVYVGGNVIYGAQYGTYFANLDNATHGPNVYRSNSGYHDAGGNSNVTAVGAG